jgi:predicted nucleic acid-binding Zn ribbon protein
MSGTPRPDRSRRTHHSPLTTHHSPPQGPERLGEILSRLFTARGWGRRQDRLRLEQAWAEAAGPEAAPHTRVAGLRRGVLEVTVANAVLLQELAHFHKRRLLEALRRRLPGTTITDLRFRAGVVAEKRG